MAGQFEAVKISEHVYWVGAIDWRIRDFHGYSTDRGTTYNAYLVLADKITLIDTVKAPFVNELMARVASIVDPSDVSYVVSDHSEMDHTGCLPRIIEELRPEKVFASTMGVKALSKHFDIDREITAVKDGETLSLGNMNLTFLETRMLHWPDSMFSYLSQDGVLFSQDAFGMHLASSERFDDEIESWILDYEAAKYYANILLPYSPLVTKLLSRVSGLDISIKVLAPDHGPIWRSDLGGILRSYGEWAAQKPTKKAVIVYDTMWQSTDLMARAIAEGVSAGGCSARLLPMRASDRSEIATEILDAGALLVGSPTLNNNMFPTIADVLVYLKGLKPANLAAAAFGSYGWSGEAVGQVTGVLTEMKVDLVSDGVRTLYVPDSSALKECRSLGELVARELNSV